MSHLGERVTDYLLEEMSAPEKAAADAHIRQCSDCAHQVEEFRSLYMRLQSVPDAEPPRRLVFESEKRSAEPWLWRWLAPAVSAVAAAVLTALFLSPSVSAPTPPTGGISLTSPAPAPTSPPYAAVSDVQSMLAEFRQESDLKFSAELDRRDREHARELQRVRGELAYWESQQRAASRETLDIATSIQLLAQR